MLPVSWRIWISLIGDNAEGTPSSGEALQALRDIRHHWLSCRRKTLTPKPRACTPLPFLFLSL
jgi:hypothetical protein